MLLLNQMAGPLFRELAEELANAIPDGCCLLTGHPDTLSIGSREPKLRFKAAPAYDRKNKISRLLSWMKFSAVAFVQLLQVERGTSVLIVSNPPFLGPIAMLVCGLRSMPYVVLVYDIHPDTIIEFGGLSKDGLLARIWRFANKAVWNKAVAVFTLGPVMAERIRGQFSPELTRLGKVGVVPPWADVSKIRPIEKTDNPLAREFDQEQCTTVLYSGNMGISHDIESILEAAKILKGRDEIKFLMIGDGAKWQMAKEFADDQELTNLTVLPFQPEKCIPFTMALGDISLVSLDKGAEGLMMPSKTYYYMAAGSAVIGICQGVNDLDYTIRTARCGVVVEPDSPSQLAETIAKLADAPDELAKLGTNARHACEEMYSREICTRNFIATLKSISFLN